MFLTLRLNICQKIKHWNWLLFNRLF